MGTRRGSHASDKSDSSSKSKKGTTKNSDGKHSRRNNERTFVEIKVIDEDNNLTEIISSRVNKKMESSMFKECSIQLLKIDEHILSNENSTVTNGDSSHQNKEAGKSSTSDFIVNSEQNDSENLVQDQLSLETNENEIQNNDFIPNDATKEVDVKDNDENINIQINLSTDATNEGISPNRNINEPTDTQEQNKEIEPSHNYQIKIDKELNESLNDDDNAEASPQFLETVKNLTYSNTLRIISGRKSIQELRAERFEQKPHSGLISKGFDRIKSEISTSFIGKRKRSNYDVYEQTKRIKNEQNETDSSSFLSLVTNPWNYFGKGKNVENSPKRVTASGSAIRNLELMDENTTVCEFVGLENNSDGAQKKSGQANEKPWCAIQ